MHAVPRIHEIDNEPDCHTPHRIRTSRLLLNSNPTHYLARRGIAGIWVEHVQAWIGEANADISFAVTRAEVLNGV